MFLRLSRLHISSVLTTYFKHTLCQLTQRAIFGGVHEHLKQILILNRSMSNFIQTVLHFVWTHFVQILQHLNLVFFLF